MRKPRKKTSNGRARRTAKADTHAATLAVSRTVDSPPASIEAAAVAAEAPRPSPEPGSADLKTGESNTMTAAADKQDSAAKVSLSDLFPPTLKETWKQERAHQQEENIRSAREAYRRRGLVLYLGAGVSCSVGLPTWWEMIRSLTVTMMSERVNQIMGTLRDLSEEQHAAAKLQIQEEVAQGAGADKSILMMARSIKNYFGPRLAYEVAQTLYSPLLKSSGGIFTWFRRLMAHGPKDLGTLGSYAVIGNSPLFRAVVQLARAQRDVRGVQAIVNFNYDDLIEEWMQENGIRCDTLLSGQEAGRDASLPSYHVHGVLPFRQLSALKNGDALALKPLIGNFVFSEDEYHTEYSDPYRWSNMTMINQLGRYSGLFIGLSLLDPNLRRLIDVTHRQYPDIKNYAILTRKPAQNAAAAASEPFLRDLFEKVETESFANIGVQVIWTDTYEEVPDRILDMCNIDEPSVGDTLTGDFGQRQLRHSEPHETRIYSNR
jgi:hypothetical protein